MFHQCTFTAQGSKCAPQVQLSPLLTRQALPQTCAPGCFCSHPHQYLQSLPGQLEPLLPASYCGRFQDARVGSSQPIRCKMCPEKEMCGENGKLCKKGEGQVPCGRRLVQLSCALKHVEDLFTVRWEEKAKPLQPIPKKAAGTQTYFSMTL